MERKKERYKGRGRKRGTKAPPKGPYHVSSVDSYSRCDLHLSLHSTTSTTTTTTKERIDIIPFFFSFSPLSFPTISSQKFSMNSSPTIMSNETPRHPIEGSSRSNHDLPPQTTTILSRYESQKRRDWNTFGQYLKNQRPPVSLSQCNCNHVLEFLRYLDQFGKTKVHLHGCVFFGQPDPPAPCTCPLRQAWGSLDALIGRLRAAYEENGGLPEINPFGNGAIRVYLREVKECQAKARGIPYKKKKKKKNPIKVHHDDHQLKHFKQSSAT